MVRVTPTLPGAFHTAPSRLAAFHDPGEELLLPPLELEVAEEDRSADPGTLHG